MTDQTLHCRELLSSYLTTQGFFTEAENVLNGVDLESYENELSIVAFVLMARAQASAPEGDPTCKDHLQVAGATEGEAVAYYCTKLRDRYGPDDKKTGEKWLEQKVTMDHNEAHMLEHDFGWTVHDLHTRSNAKAGEVDAGIAVAWIEHSDNGVVLHTLGACRALEDLPHGTHLYVVGSEMGGGNG